MQKPGPSPGWTVRIWGLVVLNASEGHPAQAFLTPLAIPCSGECDLEFPVSGLSGARKASTSLSHTVTLSTLKTDSWGVSVDSCLPSAHPASSPLGPSEPQQPPRQTPAPAEVLEPH